MVATQGANAGPREMEAKVTASDGSLSTGQLRAQSSARFNIAFSVRGANASSGRWVGDVTTVSIPSIETKLEAEILTSSLLGHVEVCDFQVVRYLDGLPLGTERDKRATARLRPKQPINITIVAVAEDGDDDTWSPTVTAGLGDISAGGCAIDFSKIDYRTIGPFTTALLKFTVPSSGEQLSLLARRMNTRVAPDGSIWMGMRWTDSPDNAAPLKVISDYVAEAAG